MHATASAEGTDDVENEAYGPRMGDQDQLVVMYGVDWRTYSAVHALLDGPGVRMTYLKGALEIKSPSWRHEHYKTTLARMIETFGIETDFPLRGYGSTTFKREAKERGVEPDECYCVGRELGEEGVPDIALEVIITSGGLDKLAVYRGLGVKEVWMFEDGRFTIHGFHGERYRPLDGSVLIPGLDFRAMEELVKTSDQHAAVKAFRDRLRGRAG